MQLPNYPNSHLTYCTNIHPGEQWDEVREQLKSHIPELKSRVSPQKPFGIGLRLSAVAARQLREEEQLRMFKEWLREENLYVFTMNGFPYGDFHGKVVKDRVYAPDWRTEDRVNYTLNLASILAQLLPDGMAGGISTSPLSYKYWLSDAAEEREVFQKSTRNLSHVAWEMAQIKKASGKEIHLDIEPEPDCLLENSVETIAFFKEWLFPRGSSFMADEYGLSSDKAKEIVRNHIRVCYDTCHFAVEYEKPEQAIAGFQEAGIRIGKTQISAALKVPFDSSTDKQTIASKLRAFKESTYLHQVIERRGDGSLYHYTDLPEALAAITESEPEEWRIHYHVPIFVDAFDGLSSTQDDIIRSLDMLLKTGDCTHFEIETYTWGVLPEDLKTDIAESIEREYNWTLDQVGALTNRI